LFDVDWIEMRHRPADIYDRPRGAPARAALLAAVFALCLPAAAAASVSPLPESDYAVRAACPAPVPGRAGCLAAALFPRTAAARARTHPIGMIRNAAIRASGPSENAYGLRPADLRTAYFPGEPPNAPVAEPQTIALVDAYDDPAAEGDLRVYSEAFGLPVLPACSGGAVSGCFEKVNQRGKTGNPPVTGAGETEKEEAAGWAMETSTDIEVAHGICNNCRILLVEASSASYTNLEEAEETAVRLGATEISNSWGGEEPPLESAAFVHPGTVITASSGDNGYLNWTAGAEHNIGADYPASSPHVVAVGGTKLTLTAEGKRASETVWNDNPSGEGAGQGAGGGGCSKQFAAPVWQSAVPDWSSVGCGTGAQAKRAVADVAADADPYTGVAVYDSVPYYAEPGKPEVLGWLPIGGTSVASPIVASLFALVGGAHGVEYPAATLYSRLGAPPGFASFYDVTTGGNGRCDGLYTGACSGSLSPLSPFDCGAGALICNAGPGYDGPTGVGAPDGLTTFTPESETEHTARVAAEQKSAEEKTAAEKKAAEELTTAEAKAAAEKKAAEERQASERKAAEALKAAEAKAAEELKAAEAKRAAEAKAEEELKARTVEEERLKLAEVQAEVEEEEESTGTSGGGRRGKASGRSRGGAVRLTRLVLTARTSATFARGLPTLSEVAFTFNLSGAARLRATLSRLVVLHGRASWPAAAGTLTLRAPKGRDHNHLRGAARLAPGTYRLTLAPVHGRPRSILFVIGATPPPSPGQQAPPARRAG
jgi:Subtilase family